MVIKFNRREVKGATYDENNSWMDYMTHLQTKLNEWTEEEKGLFFATSIWGQAQTVLEDLQGYNTGYNYLLKAVEERLIK